ncbi:hypothetical protein HDU67_009411, partial [Dinochytrium kinnereticum]
MDIIPPLNSALLTESWAAANNLLQRSALRRQQMLQLQMMLTDNHTPNNDSHPTTTTTTTTTQPHQQDNRMLADLFLQQDTTYSTTSTTPPPPHAAASTLHGNDPFSPPQRLHPSAVAPLATSALVPHPTTTDKAPPSPLISLAASASLESLTPLTDDDEEEEEDGPVNDAESSSSTLPPLLASTLARFRNSLLRSSVNASNPWNGFANPRTAASNLGPKGSGVSAAAAAAAAEAMDTHLEEPARQMSELSEEAEPDGDAQRSQQGRARVGELPTASDARGDSLLKSLVSSVSVPAALENALPPVPMPSSIQTSPTKAFTTPAGPGNLASAAFALTTSPAERRPAVPDRQFFSSAPSRQFFLTVSSQTSPPPPAQTLAAAQSQTSPPIQPLAAAQSQTSPPPIQLLATAQSQTSPPVQTLATAQSQTSPSSLHTPRIPDPGRPDLDATVSGSRKRVRGEIFNSLGVAEGFVTLDGVNGVDAWMRDGLSRRWQGPRQVKTASAQTSPRRHQVGPDADASVKSNWDALGGNRRFKRMESRLPVPGKGALRAKSPASEVARGYVIPEKALLQKTAPLEGQDAFKDNRENLPPPPATSALKDSVDRSERPLSHVATFSSPRPALQPQTPKNANKRFERKEVSEDLVKQLEALEVLQFRMHELSHKFMSQQSSLVSDQGDAVQRQALRQIRNFHELHDEHTNWQVSQLTRLRETYAKEIQQMIPVLSSAVDMAQSAKTSRDAKMDAKPMPFASVERIEATKRHTTETPLLYVTSGAVMSHGVGGLNVDPPKPLHALEASPPPPQLPTSPQARLIDEATTPKVGPRESLPPQATPTPPTPQEPSRPTTTVFTSTTEKLLQFVTASHPESPPTQPESPDLTFNYTSVTQSLNDLSTRKNHILQALANDLSVTLPPFKIPRPLNDDDDDNDDGFNQLLNQERIRGLVAGRVGRVLGRNQGIMSPAFVLPVSVTSPTLVISRTSVDPTQPAERPKSVEPRKSPTRTAPLKTKRLMLPPRTKTDPAVIARSRQPGPSFGRPQPQPQPPPPPSRPPASPPHPPSSSPPRHPREASPTKKPNLDVEIPYYTPSALRTSTDIVQRVKEKVLGPHPEPPFPIKTSHPASRVTPMASTSPSRPPRPSRILIPRRPSSPPRRVSSPSRSETVSVGGDGGLGRPFYNVRVAGHPVFLRRTTVRPFSLGFLESPRGRGGGVGGGGGATRVVREEGGSAPGVGRGSVVRSAMRSPLPTSPTRLAPTTSSTPKLEPKREVLVHSEGVQTQPMTYDLGVQSSPPEFSSVLERRRREELQVREGEVEVDVGGVKVTGLEGGKGAVESK